MKVSKKIYIVIVSVLILGVIAVGAAFILMQKQEISMQKQEISMQKQEIYRLHEQAQQTQTFKPGDKFNMQFESGMVYQCKVADGYPDCHVKGTEK